MISAMPLAFAASPIVGTLSTMYTIGKEINSWVDRHIELMQESDNQTIASTGKVLAGAKFGFGIGYIAPMIAIATGQMLLGNTFAAAGTIGTTLTFTNPIAMTCASIGAIYYGWSALSDGERNTIIKNLSEGLCIGIELIKSVVHYIIGALSDLKRSKIFSELRGLISDASSAFGKKLSDVTKSNKDRFDELTEYLITTVKTTGETTITSAEGIWIKTINALPIASTKKQENTGQD